MRLGCGTWRCCVLLLATAWAGCSQPKLAPLPPPDDPHYDDAWIVREVSIRLDRDRELSRFQIYVQSTSRVVFLQGAVPSESLRQRAGRLAAGTPCVVGVRNNIAVIRQPLPKEQPGPP
ncbi:MAG: BON domain-containing protein [Phycisphaerae bacterium]|nr:BON domain-containing protein [Phycisphaerae bacterium]